jgi:hypothetical protein
MIGYVRYVELIKTVLNQNKGAFSRPMGRFRSHQFSRRFAITAGKDVPSSEQIAGEDPALMLEFSTEDTIANQC